MLLKLLLLCSWFLGSYYAKLKIILFIKRELSQTFCNNTPTIIKLNEPLVVTEKFSNYFLVFLKKILFSLHRRHRSRSQETRMTVTETDRDSFSVYHQVKIKYLYISAINSFNVCVRRQLKLCIFFNKCISQYRLTLTLTAIVHMQYVFQIIQ